MPFSKIQPRRRGRIGQRKTGVSYRISDKMTAAVSVDRSTLTMLGIQPEGSRVDIYEGTGADTGKLAIVAARDGRAAFRANGNSPHRCTISFGISDSFMTFLGGRENATTPTTYVEWELDGDMLVLDTRRPLDPEAAVFTENETSAKTDAEYAN